MCACVPYSYFLEDLYRVDDIVTIVLTMHFDPFCNDDCPQVSWAIISVKGDWQIPFVDVPRSRTIQLFVHLACQRLGLYAAST